MTTTEVTDPVREVKLALAELNDTFNSQMKFGATDTEPEGVLTQSTTDFITMYGDLRATGLEWDAIRDHVSEYAWRISK